MIAIRRVTVYQLIMTMGAVSFSYCLPDHQHHFLIILCGILVLGLGLPHGALDHVLFYAVYQNMSNRLVGTDGNGKDRHLAQKGVKSNEYLDSKLFIASKSDLEMRNEHNANDIGPCIVFYSNYFFMMSAWAFSWYMYPLASFWAFMAVSCWHFGEGDLGYLDGVSYRLKALLYISRGALIIGLTMTSQPTVTLPIIQHLIQVPDSLFFAFSEMVPSIVCIFHFMALWRVWCLILFQSFPFKEYPSSKDRLDESIFPAQKELISVDNLLLETLKSILFTALYLVLNPLFAFSLYFGIWHGFGCIHEFIQWLKQNQWAGFTKDASLLVCRDNTVSWNDYLFFYRLAAPYTLISILGMGILYLGWDLMKQGQTRVVFDVNMSLVWAVFIGCISVLTGGHFWVVAGMYWPDYWNADPVGMKK